MSNNYEKDIPDLKKRMADIPMSIPHPVILFYNIYETCIYKTKRRWEKNEDETYIK